LSIIIFGLVTWFTIRIEKKKNPPKMAALPKTSGWKRIFRGSWPLFAAAIALAVLNALTLMTRGSPWGITSAFYLWGSKISIFFINSSQSELNTSKIRLIWLLFVKHVDGIDFFVVLGHCLQRPLL